MEYVHCADIHITKIRLLNTQSSFGKNSTVSVDTVCKHISKIMIDTVPTPGDLIVALHSMRSWETDTTRGTDGQYIFEGEQAIVIMTWSVGKQIRMKTFRNDRILVFSCAEHCVLKNWIIASRPSSDQHLVPSIISRVCRATQQQHL